jgi:hypothetical protein
MGALNDPPEIQIVFVSPGGAQSAPMKFDDSGRLVAAEKEKRKQSRRNEVQQHVLSVPMAMDRVSCIRFDDSEIAGLNQRLELGLE